MNQTLKSRVYSKGTQAQIDFMADKGGMNAEEKKMFQMFHDGKSDIYIQNALNISSSTMTKMERNISTKLCVAVFYCIGKVMNLETN